MPKKRMDAGSRRLMARINKVEVAVDDFLEIVEKTGEIPEEDRCYETFVITVCECGHHGDMLQAIMFRLQALARTIGDDLIRGWTLEKQDDGNVPTSRYLFMAAAAEPMIDVNGDVGFDREFLLQRALKLAEAEGEA